MASWPGTLWNRSSQPSSIANVGAKSRSEACLDDCSFAPQPPIPQLEEIQGDDRIWNSTGSETQQPQSAFHSEEVQKTTPTTPIFGLAEQEIREKSQEPIKSRRWLPQTLHNWDDYESTSSSSVPTFRFQYLPEPNEASEWYHMPEPPPESAQETRAKVMNLLDEVLSAHEDVSAKRHRIREMRHMLRQKRDEEGDVRITLRSKLNLITAENVHDDLAAINDTINELQDATASYFILENEYHRQENELAELEYDYNKRLERLQAILENQGHSLANRDAMESDTASSSADYTSDYGDEPSPQMAEYLSMVGEARILVERLSEMETEYLILSEQREQHAKLGIPQDNYSINFILRYTGEKAKIESELELARHKVESHPEHSNHLAQVDGDIDEDEEDEMIQYFLPEKPEDQRCEDPLRSSEFDDPSPFFAAAHAQPVNKGSFVDRWLLHRLRHSSFEIMRFKSAPELVDLRSKGWESDNISKMAMRLWFQDGAATVEHVRSHSGG
ncbi:hypothetical protein N7457_008722 [Penicillium paradoxum]|uniref:uncharacterized protein n=1 Tax=Penicillium paradoxum TaxID=176176 RepID=UPI0025484CA9|nr:uncharacterized protein N7457_008722 [Penicillium paradoxum]KAJ5773826.1 hypothetical protein N7457_008722 [Penicillium paradoxum]